MGQSFGQALVQFIGSQVPPQLKDAVAAIFTPFVGAFDTAFHQAFSLAVGDVFFIGVVTGVVAIVASLFMEELPLRSTLAPQAASRPSGEPALAKVRATD